jgi:isochorismate hydrolase
MIQTHQNYRTTDGHTFDRALLMDCHGFGIKVRKEDGHVELTLLTEDDESWFISKSQTFSSYWLTELAELVAATEKFLNHHYTRFEWGWKQK